ncbi:uncharacterized protein RHIMIDRAFT_240546 [Rhizopus microsporus ATCC 52813]|uniref:Uncharacterized protein n=1 Tax=Rhizopus microsporus ATCC 52813 TaxID=1340429 RepID=A0A2G4SKZ9_RHIZD|nr:uncharacterized protein RHIMIDRAFT_240546 [Rhizopus microsporus ATCC 52813]PHZ09434.1 hypothetical protein RHIMIDRAFT_240546 [Rhizopus microsporus ATCC 52813]
MYNYKLIWPLLQLVANHLDVAFEPGEAILGSSSDQMYNADDLIKVGTDNALVLETSGLYELHDKPRFGYNQIKGIFRALTMLRSVVKKMKHEHSDYMLSLQMNDDAEERPNLSGWVVQKIQKPEKGKEFGLLLPEEFEEFKVARKIVGC